MNNDDNKFYINEDSQLYTLASSNITQLGKKARTPGRFFMDENILCLKNSKDKVFKIFGYKENSSLDDPSIWYPYGLIAGKNNSNSSALLGAYNKESEYVSDIARISWIIKGKFTIQTFGEDTLEKIIIVRHYPSENKTITAIEGQELNNFLGKKALKSKFKM
jgi:hypothetical protein